MPIHTRSRLRWRVVLPATLVIGGLVAAACGGDNKSSGSSATTAAASTAAGGAATTAASGGAASSSDPKAVVDKYLQRPTSIDLKTPVGKPIPTGLKLYFISCGVEACAAEADIIKQATDILGWTFTKISTDGSPQQIQ